MSFQSKPSNQLLFAIEALNSDENFQILVNALHQEYADLTEQSLSLNDTSMIYRNQGQRVNLKDLFELVENASEWIRKRKNLMA